MRKQHLGLAEKEQTFVIQCKMKAGDDARLRFRVEVHQRVPADEQIEPRNRRILNEIEATEDHRAAKLAFHHELVGVRVLEILRAELCRHGRNRFSVVNAMPCLGERIGIDIGGVDFHAIAKALLAERLGEQHGDAVRFFARRASDAAHANGISGPLRFQHPWNDFARHVVPGGGVAEKGGDVDEDRIEKRHKLLGMHLEIVLIVFVGLDVLDGRHPLQDAARQR